MKVAFFFGLKSCQNTLVDARIDNGNPGVGGTQYLFLLTVKYLNKRYGSQYAMLLTDTQTNLSDGDIPECDVESIYGAIRYCEEKGISVLVLNANALDSLKPSSFETNLRLIFWAHNTLSGKRQVVAAEHKSIERIVCVSEKQYLNMKDSQCFKKCVYINNVIPEHFYTSSDLTNYAEKKVAYVGSIMPQKGVHNLLSIWKYVEEKEPNAQLYIFGSANVWNQDLKMGSLGVADRYYDKIIQRKLNRLKHPENIHFMGTMGWEKINHMINTFRVGVVNPSYYMRDETFCMSAIEMEAHGLPIVSRQRNDGLCTAVEHAKTGFLESSDKEIADRICLLLYDDAVCSKMGFNARQYSQNFIIDKEISKWNDIIENPLRSVCCKKGFTLQSRDSRLLVHDFALKLFYLVSSGKAIDILLKRKDA